MNSKRTSLVGLGSAALLALASSFPSARAAQLIWTGASGADILWSTPANWDPAGPPGAADVAFFNDTAIVGDAATINNRITSSTTVQGLVYRHNSGYHNTELATGNTLTIESAGTGVVFGVGSETSPAAPQTERVTISGGGSIVVNAPTADLVVRQGSGGGSASKAVLDLSGLESLTADVAHLWVGVANPPGYVSANRTTGDLLLPRRNNIRARTSTAAAPGIDVGKSTSNNGGGSSLLLGQENEIYSDMLGFGRVKENGVSMRFNPAFTAEGNATAKFRAADGASRVVNWTIGDGVTDGATTSVRGTNDFTGGSVDAMVDLMVIGRTSSSGDGNVVHKGILTFDKGRIDVNTLRAAVQATAGAASQKSGDAVINVNGTAELVVNTSLDMGVLANPSSPGAGTTVSTLNINGGTLSAAKITATLQPRTTLIVTNGGTLKLTSDEAFVGTVDAPLDRVNLADANIETFGASGRIVAETLFIGGTSNAIKLTGLPVVNEYPARIPIINFGFLEIENTFNLSIASFPAADPAYQGTLELNEAAGIVELVLTAGPLPVVLTWNGLTSANWDFTTANFLNGATPRVFANGDAVLFNDAGGGSMGVVLVGELQPGVVTVNNTTRAYAFEGDGYLSGTASLTKSGAGTLTIANTTPNTFSGGVNITGGTLIVGAAATAGSLPAGPIVNDATLVFNRSDNVTINGAISGIGSVTQMGQGTLTLAGLNPYTGPTTVSAGNLAIAGDLGSSAVIFTGGGKLSGGGTIAGAVTTSGQVDPGAGATVGTLAMGGLTLNNGSTLKLDLTSDTTAGATFNDFVVVNGNLTLNNNTIVVNFLGTPTVGVPYTLLTYAGAKTGNFNAAIQGTHLTATLDQSVAGVITVTFSGEGAALKWASTTSGEWDSILLNWLNAGGAASAFFAGDAVLFDDSVPNTVTDITLNTIAAPSAVTVSSERNYTVSGSGKITGATGIEKFGTGAFSLNTANDFTGAVNIHGGTLKAGSQTALGAAAGETTVMSGATLDVGGSQLNAELITVSGAGQGGVGAIINTGAQQINAVGRVVLAGDTTFGGTGRWDLRGGGANLSSGGMPYNLAKVGPNQVSFVGATIDPVIADIDIREGIFGIQTTTVQNSGGSFGDPEKTIAIQSAGTLELWNLGANYPLFKRIVVNDGGTIWNENGVTAISGDITLNGNANLNVGGTSLDLRNVVTGTGGITKTGAGALLINAENTYTGETHLNQGTTTISDTGSIAASAIIDVAANATLNVSTRTDATLTLAPGQTLTGAGTINGSLVATAGSTVNPNGRLTIANDVTLNGATTLDLGGAVNDSLRGGFINAGGTLNLNVVAPIPGGTTIQVFEAAGFTGAFTAITPATPGPGQTWVTSNLLIDGTITVNGDAVSPRFTATTLSNGNIIMSGSGGSPNGAYQIRGSNDVTTAVSTWPVAATGNFAADGTFSSSLPTAGSFKFFVLVIGN